MLNAVIPPTWCKAIISPIFKGKGKDTKDPLSYRPVSLICNVCKGFSYILNKGLLTYLESNNILVEEQNGFRKVVVVKTISFLYLLLKKKSHK